MVNEVVGKANATQYIKVVHSHGASLPDDHGDGNSKGADNAIPGFIPLFHVDCVNIIFSWHDNLFFAANEVC